MPIDNIAQQTRIDALASFMGRSTQINDQVSGTSPNEVVDNLSQSSTGFKTPPFVNQVQLNDFWVPQPDPVSVQLVGEPVVPQTLFESVRTTVCGLVTRPIKATKFCLAFVGFGFPQSAVSALLKKMGLTCEKNGNSMVDIRGMNESLDEFVESLVQMKEIVDFVVAVIISLNKKPNLWAILRNPSSPDNYIQTPLPKEVLQLVRRCLTTMGFSEGNKDVMKVPSNLASLSAPDLLEKIWTVVSKYDWEFAPQKAVKRGRNDYEVGEEMRPADQQVVKKQFTNEQLVKTLIAQLVLALLETHGAVELSLNEFFSIAFLSLPSVHLRQMMKFLSNPDNVWVFHRILIEVPHLRFISRNNDVYLWIEKIELFSCFNMTEMIRQYHLFSMEAIVHRQNASQRIHEERVREEQKREHNQRLNEFLRFLLGNLWMTKDMNPFFVGLRHVCPEFDSNHTNWNLLNFVVYEFLQSIYNATTHQYYHNTEPCFNIADVFIQYVIVRGVFSRRPPVNEKIRVCKYRADDCPFGPKCSGVHQAFVSSGWKKGCVWGECCPEYSDTRRCTNKRCSNAHFTGDEFKRAFQNGGKDSKQKRNDLLAQAYIAKR